MNPKSYGYTPRPVEVTRVFMSKEDKARYELEHGERREETLKRLHTEQDREVKEAQMEAQRLEMVRMDTGRTLREVRLRNEQLRQFLALAEVI